MRGFLMVHGAVKQQLVHSAQVTVVVVPQDSVE